MMSRTWADVADTLVRGCGLVVIIAMCLAAMLIEQQPRLLGHAPPSTPVDMGEVRDAQQ